MFVRASEKSYKNKIQSKLNATIYLEVNKYGQLKIKTY